MGRLADDEIKSRAGSRKGRTKRKRDRRDSRTGQAGGPVSSRMMPPPTICCNSQHPPSRLPNELHRYVLAFVNGMDDRPTLFACALVCRTWFQSCKVQLFRNIVLKGPVSLKRVLKHLETPDSCLVQHARSVFVEHQQGQPPWAHNALFGLAGRLPRIEEISFESSSTLDSHNKATNALAPKDMMFSSNPSMTRTLPGLFARFTHLTRLRLDYYQFQSLMDLLRIVGAIPTLRTLGCHRLSWTHTPASLSKSSHRQLKHQLRTVSVTRCPVVWPMLHFFAASSRLTAADRVTRSGQARSRKHGTPGVGTMVFPGLDCVDVGLMSEIGACFGLGSSTAALDLHIMCRPSRHPGVWVICVQDIYRLHELQFHVGSLTDSAADTDPVVVKEIIFVLHTGLHRGQSAGGVPVGLNDVLLKLAHLRRVVFDADWDEAAEETALSSFSPSLRAKVETAEGAASRAWRSTTAWATE